MDSKLYEEIGNVVKKAQKSNGSLTEQNLLYVVKVATDLASKTGADLDMLISEGVIAMKKAEDKYDPEQNNNFVKYCAPAIRGYMLNAINRQGSIVHIPVNHLSGFKKGQEKLESANVEYMEIDSTDYDTLGYEEDHIFRDDMDAILQRGLNRLDINGRIAMEMKLHLGKYSEITNNPSDPSKKVYKYKNNIQSIADELEVPVPTANKIYKEAFTKLSKYCQSACNE